VGINTGEIIVTSIGDAASIGKIPPWVRPLRSLLAWKRCRAGHVLVSANTYAWSPVISAGRSWARSWSRRQHGDRRVPAFRASQRRGWRIQEYGFLLHHFLTGRSAEFQLLSRTIEELYGGSGGIAIVSGETGLGKSFLVSKVREHFNREEILRAEAQQGSQGHAPKNHEYPRITWLTGSCRSYDQSWPYSLCWISCRNG